MSHGLSVQNRAVRDDGEALGRIDPLLAAAGKSLRDAAAALRSSVDHRGEAGRGREHLLARTFEALLPRRFTIGSGFILGQGPLISDQQDLVLYNGTDYPTFSYAAGILAVPESVYAAISVRTRLRPSDLEEHARAAAGLKALISGTLGVQWSGLYIVLGYQFEGRGDDLRDLYHRHVFASPKGTRIDLVATLDGPACFDLSQFNDDGRPPAFVADRAHVLGIALDACGTEVRGEPFVDFYKLLLLGLEGVHLLPSMNHTLRSAAPSVGFADPAGYARDERFQAVFAGKSADLLLEPGMTGYFTLFYLNTGTSTWVRGTEAEARLGVAGPAEHRTPLQWANGWLSSERYCAHTQERVSPGQIATFTFAITAPDDATEGTYRFYCRPVVERVGALLPESHANAVTVVKELPVVSA